MCSNGVREIPGAQFQRYPGSMRALTVIVVAIAAITVAGSGAASTSGLTALNVTYWANGTQSDPQTWTLRCNPPRGTLPHPGVACRRLVTGGWKLVAPVPLGSVCTEIYGGPQVARVVGFVQGKKVWARFTRVNGCQISRWNRLAPWLFPAGSANS